MTPKYGERVKYKAYCSQDRAKRIEELKILVSEEILNEARDTYLEQSH